MPADASAPVKTTAIPMLKPRDPSQSQTREIQFRLNEEQFEHVLHEVSNLAFIHSRKTDAVNPWLEIRQRMLEALRNEKLGLDRATDSPLERD